MNRQARTGLAVRRLAKALKPAAPDSGFVPMTGTVGTVKTVTPAGSVDGLAQVEVTVNGTDTLTVYVESYTTPTVGHTVLVAFLNGSPVIVGRVVGFPTF